MKCQKSKIFDQLRKKQSFFQNKGQGLSLNTIIIAAIVLIVLVVLWAIFTGRMGVFTSGLKEEDVKARIEADKFKEGTLSLGGSCATDATCSVTCTGNKIIYKESLSDDKKCSSGLVCCKTE